jgi:hypothetical protein
VFMELCFFLGLIQFSTVFFTVFSTVLSHELLLSERPDLLPEQRNRSPSILSNLTAKPRDVGYLVEHLRTNSSCSISSKKSHAEVELVAPLGMLLGIAVRRLKLDSTVESPAADPIRRK